MIELLYNMFNITNKHTHTHTHTHTNCIISLSQSSFELSLYKHTYKFIDDFHHHSMILHDSLFLLLRSQLFFIYIAKQC